MFSGISSAPHTRTARQTRATRGQQSFYEYVVGVGGKENTALVNKTLNDGTEVKANPRAARIAAIHTAATSIISR